MDNPRTYCAFAGQRLLVSGSLEQTALAAKTHVERAGEAGPPVLIFEEQTGRQVELDLSGSVAEVLQRLADEAPCSDPSPPPRSGPGRPKLGVVSREVSLLPRHWQWLERQSGGASATLRKLVELSRKSGEGEERARDAREAASKFMWAMTGNLPGFEEATRALFAKDQPRLEQLIAGWPDDLCAQVQKLTREAARLEREAAEKSAES